MINFKVQKSNFKREVQGIIPLILCFLLFILICSGCAKSPPSITILDPQVTSPNQRVIKTEEKGPYVVYESPDFDITARLYERGGLFGLSLRVNNHTNHDIKADEYFIHIADGRDHKPLKILSRQEVIDYRNKIVSGNVLKTGNQMVDYSLGEISGVFMHMTKTEASTYLSYIDWGIGHYFASRPIYAKEQREGIIIAIADFILEYPISVIVKIRGQEIDFHFHPLDEQ